MSMDHKTNEQIVIRIKNGEDPERDMERLYGQVKGFIHSIAWRYRKYAELEDLEQEGYLALYPAIAGYAPAAGNKFLTYAGNWIRQAMIRYIQNNGTIRLPVYEQDQIRKYCKFCEAFYSQTGRKPSDYEAAYYLGVDKGKIQRLQTSLKASQVQSLDMTVTDDKDVSLSDIVPDPEDVEEKVLNGIDACRLQEVLWAEVDSLSDIQSKVIRAIYQKSKTLKQTGELIGVNAHQIRTIKCDALRDLGKPRHSRKLVPFLPELYESQVYRHNSAGEFNRTWTSSTERIAMRL